MLLSNFYLSWNLAINLVTSFVAADSCRNIPKCSVVTTSGSILGDCSDSAVSKYFSIPYAKPPVGQLRLENPVMFVQDLSETVDGRTIPPQCPQLGGDDESEDCLYLNIWAPTDSGHSKPVLFWIHGGSNWKGSGSDPLFDGTKFAQSQGVIVVTFNYRLGILGFFDNGENTNFAIKDTILALKWVKDNIMGFGGDPNRITVFGNSSAGSIIRALMSSEKANGLFNNAIIQSDPEAYGFSTRNVSNTITNYFLQTIKCADISCLKDIEISSIITAQLQTFLWIREQGTSNHELNTAYFLGPVIDGDLIYKDYSTYLSTGTLPNPVDMIVGFTKDEAGPTINSILQSPPSTTDWESLLSYLLEPDQVASIVKDDIYTLGNSSDAVRILLTQFGTDYYWMCPTEYNAGLIANRSSSRVFIYQLEQGIQHPDNAIYSICDGKVCHQDDIMLTFGTYSSSTTTQELKNLSDSIQRAWSQFAKYGNPKLCNNQPWISASSSSSLNICHLGISDFQDRLSLKRCQELNKIRYPFELYSS